MGTASKVGMFSLLFFNTLRVLTEKKEKINKQKRSLTIVLFTHQLDDCPHSNNSNTSFLNIIQCSSFINTLDQVELHWWNWSCWPLLSSNTSHCSQNAPEETESQPRTNEVDDIRVTLFLLCRNECRYPLIPSRVDRQVSADIGEISADNGRYRRISADIGGYRQYRQVSACRSMTI